MINTVQKYVCRLWWPGQRRVFIFQSQEKIALGDGAGGLRKARRRRHRRWYRHCFVFFFLLNVLSLLSNLIIFLTLITHSFNQPGDLFMQFLDKINNISNRVPGVSSSSSTSNLQQQQVAEQASALVTATSVNSLITSTSTGSLNHGTAVAAGGAALPSIPPSISLSCVPAADADNILPAGPASAAPRIISLSDGAAGSQAMEEV